jgi:hypothetical protein
MGITARLRVASCIGLVTGLALAAVLAAAGTVSAQTPPPASDNRGGIGEKYWVEFSVTTWKPSLTGSIASDSLQLIGSQIDFASDLALSSSQFSDFRVVLHPARKHRIRFQYTPTSYTGDSVLARDITFAGKVYPVALPVQSTLSWDVWRVSYEWDFFYRPRGFVGAIVQGGVTDLKAGISSILGSGEVTGSAPLVAVGVAGRVYPIRHLAINVEVTGLKLTDLKPDHVFKTMSYDVSATYNFTRVIGASGGWRRADTMLKLDSDSGDLNFGGLWFGAVVRY